MTKRACTALLSMLLLSACAAGMPGPTPESRAIARGRALYANKGCGTCHTNRRAAPAGTALDVGPDLSLYRNDPAFLRRWLADPSSIRPETRMPQLGLSSQEIDDLVAFLNEAR